VNDFTDAPGDPLGALLAPHPHAENDPLRRRLREQTTRQLRARRRRRLALAAAVCAAGLAGLLVWQRAAAPPPVPQPEPSHDLSMPSLDPSEAAPADAPSALAEEWRAFDAADGRADRYRRAGDRYLKEDGDPESALRCYAAALDHAPADALDVSAEDGWLLLLVKDARQKEKIRAKLGE
jgi:hypothetical protein